LPAGYPGDHWHAVLVRILVAARANGLAALDGPHLAIEDLDGLRASALRARVLGYDGKWAIHPSQLEVIDEAFSPTPEEVARARAILAALDEAAGEGTGAVRFGAEMLDEASRRMAERVLARARASGTA
jgi:citrate lyase subunit beta/citryl-CoA lyase